MRIRFYGWNYDREEGARFEIHYEKARAFYGRPAEPFEVQLVDTDEGGVTWHASDIRDDAAEKVILMSAQGLSQRQIAEETGINVSIVNRMIKKHREKQAA